MSPPAATSPPSRWLPSRLMRGLTKISGDPLLCSVLSRAGAAPAGETLGRAVCGCTGGCLGVPTSQRAPADGCDISGG